ncbi:MAG: NAD(P)-binding domain-containing protein [Myxococcota bacterium]|nr:NAD(P)-binding domain-containing protein [Myxococcota bacterium]
MTPTKIGVLGSGDVGRVLGSGFVSRGHEVQIGSRDPKSDKVQKWVKDNGARASSGTFGEVAEFGEICVLATLWTGTKSAIDLAGPDAFAGKVVIDATNPLDFSQGSPPRLALGHTDSAGEQVQRWIPKAHVVKCFNIVGNAHMVDPKFPGGPPDMWIAGNDDGAKVKVGQILRAFGWPDPIDVGGIEGARLLEPMCLLWVLYGARAKSWNHAFKLLRG